MAKQPPTNPSALQPWQVLHSGAVGIYRFALDVPNDELAQLAELLDENEQARAARFAFDDLRKRFIAAHGQMRRALAACLPGQSAAGLRVATTPHGKPYLKNGALRFNLSHSRDLALLAVSATHEVGIDTEAVRQEVDYGVIATRFFAPAEVEAIQRLSPVQQVHAFYACWTRKEAYIKARGLGLKIALDRFAISLPPDDPPRLLIPEPGVEESFTFYSLDPGPGFAAALCVASLAVA